MRWTFRGRARRRPLMVIAATAVIVIATAVACNHDRLSPLGARKISIAQSNQLGQGHFAGSSHRRPPEDQSVRLANEIPGFGGIFINSAHQLVAYIKDTTAGRTSTNAAAAALRAHLSADGFGVPSRIRPTSVRTLPADYDWETLSGYRDFISDSLGNYGLVMVWIDVAINRVSVTVDASRAGGVSNLAGILKSHGIPLAAINITSGAVPKNSVRPIPPREVRRRFTPAFTDLRNVDPDSLMGGIQIGVEGGDGGGTCSIGAVVDSAGFTRLLTASHCSKEIWKLTPDSVRTASGNLIGRETTDLGWSLSCLVPCVHHRGSDDALYSMDATYGAAHARIGAIARPVSRDSGGLYGPWHTAIDSVHPMLYVYDTLTSSSLWVGEEVDKIGKSSGWQKGQMIKVCADYWLVTPTWKVYCAGEAYATFYWGDSGGPVFIWDGADGALLVGTANAVDHNYPNLVDTIAVAGFFSPWSSIVTENGPIDPRNNTTVGTPSLTAVDSSGFAKVSWSAVSTTHTSSTTQYQIYQWTWDASTSTYTENGAYKTTITSLSYKDGGAPWSITAVAGSTQPDKCTYSAIGIAVKSYNRGAYAWTSTVWFQGPANGPGGLSC